MITLTQATHEDLPEILKLQYDAFLSEADLLDNYSIQPLTQTLAEIEQEFAEKIFLKATDDEQGKIIGSVRASIDKGVALIGKLIVHPDYQRQGIGKLLLSAIEKEAGQKRCELFTSAQSPRNLQFYNKMGYKALYEKEFAPGLKFVYFQKEL